MGKTTACLPQCASMQGGGDWVSDVALQPSPSKEYHVYRSQAAVRIELSRPENSNVLTASMVEELKNLYRRIAQDPTVFRIYLTGQGRVFCAGMNLGASGLATSADEGKHLAQLKNFRDLLTAIERAPQVTVALINGPCYGGGNGLAFVNDIRISTRDTTFNLTEVRLGLSPCAISPYLAREWGIALFRSAMLTGRPVTAAQLHGSGALYAITDNNMTLQNQALHDLETTLRMCASRASTVCKELVEVAWSSPGGPAQDDLIKRRYLEMMAPSREAKYGIEQFRKGVRMVNWASMEKSTRGKSSLL